MEGIKQNTVKKKTDPGYFSKSRPYNFCQYIHLNSIGLLHPHQKCIKLIIIVLNDNFKSFREKNKQTVMRLRKKSKAAKFGCNIRAGVSELPVSSVTHMVMSTLHTNTQTHKYTYT